MTAPPSISALSDVEQEALNRMWRQLHAKRQKNELLTIYYDGHRAFQDLGISIPPQMKMTRAALGWPAKAVSALARKHVFEGYALAGNTDPFEVGEILTRNDFATQLAQGIVAAYTSACSFLVVSPGNTAEGEPEVLIRARDARDTTAILDPRTGRVASALLIEDAAPDPDKSVGELRTAVTTRMTMLLPNWVIFIRRDDRKWVVERHHAPFGRVMVEPLVYDPQLRRPFGRSRISREVRYWTDAGLRTAVRAETGAEFFSSPQRYILGADEEVFDDLGRWSAILGRLWGLPLNEEGQAPTVGQFTQMSMEPHLAMFRQIAQNMCAATNLPMSSVGIFADNPASAEAMQAAEYALSDEAEYQWRIFAPALRRVVEDVVMLRDGTSEAPSEAWKMAINWTPARYVSPQASSDFIVKTVQALPKVADTTVALRRAGFTQGEIEQIEAETARARSVGLVEALTADRNSSPAVETPQEG